MIPGTYSELKRGRKPCPACDAIIGAGRKKCPVPSCKHVFGSAAPKQKQAKAQPTATLVPGADDSAQSVLVVPAGKCPAQLLSTRREDVLTWMDKVVRKWRAANPDSTVCLSVEALEWWARQFFPFRSAQHNRVCNIMRASAGGEPTLAG